MPSPKLTGSGGDGNEATIATVQMGAGAIVVVVVVVVVSYKYARARAFVGFEALALSVLLNAIAHHRWLTKSTGNMKC